MVMRYRVIQRNLVILQGHTQPKRPGPRRREARTVGPARALLLGYALETSLGAGFILLAAGGATDADGTDHFFVDANG